MKISELLELDCRDKANLVHISDRLHSLPLFADHEDDQPITLEDLEKALAKLKKRTTRTLSSVCFNAGGRNNPSYHIGYINNLERPGTEKVLYGLTLWEVLAKAVIYMFAAYKRDKGGN